MNALARLAIITITGAVATSAGAAPAIRPPHSSAHGATLGEWARRFFEWDGGLPLIDGSHPALDLGDVDCGHGQDGSVWFLESQPVLDGPLERRCSIPAGATLYVPILQWVCPKEIDGREVADCLADADFIFGVVDLGLTVDGHALDDAALEAYRARTGRFELTVAEDTFWETFCGCELGTTLDFGADAIGALVGPLPIGEHAIVISYRSELFGFAGSLTYRITVTPRA